MKLLSKFALLLLFTLSAHHSLNAAITATISADATVCQKAPKPVITFTGSGGTAPYTFTYKINGGGDKLIKTISGSDVATINVSTNNAGVFIYELIKVEDGSGSVDLTEQVTITVNALPTINGSLNTCLGGGSIQLTGSETPFTTTPWVSSDPSIATIDITGLVKPVAAGNTTITYTNINGCEVKENFVVNALPIAGFTFTNDNQCSGTNINFTPSLTGDYSYEWDFGDGDTLAQVTKYLLLA